MSRVNQILLGDALEVLKTLDSESVNCIVTSPPYFNLRDYGVAGQIGLESTVEEYVNKLVMVFREARRVLSSDGTCWINLGDSYNGSGKGKTQKTAIGKSTAAAGLERPTKEQSLKPKDLLMIPARVAIALQADGWYLRNDIIWHKPDPVPESVRDRCTRSHEHIFLLSKSRRYYWNHAANQEVAAYGHELGMLRSTGNSGVVQETPSIQTRKAAGVISTKAGDGYRNRRDVWSIVSEGYAGAHYAPMPLRLALNCIETGCKPQGMVLDPFGGVGTTALAAIKAGAAYTLIELNPAYIQLAERRIAEFDPAADKPQADGSIQKSLFSLLEQGG